MTLKYTCQKYVEDTSSNYRLSNRRNLFIQPGNKDIYQRLQTQCRNMNIPIHPPPTPLESLLPTTDVILDAIFGFSFNPPARAPFDTALALIAAAQRHGTPVVSVDIPSGWDVERGPIPIVPLVEGAEEAKKAVESSGTEEGEGKGWLEPDVLVSLTAPKLGAKGYKGRHFLGGRFVSKCVIDFLFVAPSIDYFLQGARREVSIEPARVPRLRADC
jgi:NAD(P)H-hydrate epimerase